MIPQRRPKCGVFTLLQFPQRTQIKMEMNPYPKSHQLNKPDSLWTQIYGFGDLVGRIRKIHQLNKQKNLRIGVFKYLSICISAFSQG